MVATRLSRGSIGGHPFIIALSQINQITFPLYLFSHALIKTLIQAVALSDSMGYLYMFKLPILHDVVDTF
jgi:hypothetical protein